MARTIQSPGVEINETDLTLRAVTPEGTSVFITGFADQGPIDEVLQPTTLSEFEQIYGSPTNDAERYFYHSVRSVINSSPAKVFVTRLPYGEERGEGFSTWRYSALAYPVFTNHSYFVTTSAFGVNTIFITNSGFGYAQLPNYTIRDFTNRTNSTVLQLLTALDDSGTGTFGITGVNIITTSSDDFVTQPSVSLTPSFIIQSAVVNVSGSGYVWSGTPVDLPIVNLVSDVGTYVVGASAEAELADDGIGQFNILSVFVTNSATGPNQNNGYQSTPQIIAIDTGFGISPAEFEAELGFYNSVTNTFTITSVNVIDPGFGYTSIPTLSVVGGNPIAGAVAPTFDVRGVTTPTYGISSIRITDFGLGYQTAPAIEVEGVRIGSNEPEGFVEGLNGTPSTLIDGTQFIFSEYEDVPGNAAPMPLGGDEFSVPIDDPFDARGFKYLGKTCFVGKPTHVELTAEEYENIQSGNITWSNYPTVSSQNFVYETLGNSAFLVLNKSQTTVNNKYEGYYVGLIDNSNYNPATDFDGILSVQGIGANANAASLKAYTKVPNSRLAFALSATNLGDGSSVSEVMENLSNYDLADNSFKDTISFGLFKLRQNNYSPDSISLTYNLTENYVGSLDYHRTIGDRNGGRNVSFSLEKITENSSNVKVIFNPYLSNRYGSSTLGNDGVPLKSIRFLTSQIAQPLNNRGFIDTKDSYTTRIGATSATVANLIAKYGTVDSLFPLGVYESITTSDKRIGSLPKKLDRAFELVDNADVYPINIAIEGGLGTVYVNSLEQSNTNGLSANEYSAATPLKSLSSFYITNFDGLDSEGLNLRSNYTSIANIFINVAEKQRKDFLVILDPIKNIFIQGENNKVINSKKLFSPNAGIGNDPKAPGFVTANFSQHIYWPLRHQFGTINCSYATTYASWAQVVDPNTNKQIWIPFSGIAAATMANTDANFQPWFAPAGFTRGIVTGANDIAIYPKQKQRDQLYKISINPVTFFPNEGFVIFGQKTLLKKPSAFDRINVRRLFLNLEIATKNTVKFFVFEPNTLFTRTQVINVLTPIFENARNTEGVYDYRIVCSERNNTPDVIDNNELKIDIYIQPVRTAEFILVNFIATRTGTNFDELIGG